MRDLAQTIQALYDSEINVTITMLWDGGIEFALCSSMQMCDPGCVWHHVDQADQLAEKVSGLTEVRDSDIVVRVAKDPSITDYAARNIDSRTCARPTNCRLR
jgi:hypothetical protein